MGRATSSRGDGIKRDIISRPAWQICIDFAPAQFGDGVKNAIIPDSDMLSTVVRLSISFIVQQSQLLFFSNFP